MELRFYPSAFRNKVWIFIGILIGGFLITCVAEPVHAGSSSRFWNKVRRNNSTPQQAFKVGMPGEEWRIEETPIAEKGTERTRNESPGTEPARNDATLTEAALTLDTKAELLETSQDGNHVQRAIDYAKSCGVMLLGSASSAYAFLGFAGASCASGVCPLVAASASTGTAGIFAFSTVSAALATFLSSAGETCAAGISIQCGGYIAVPVIIGGAAGYLVIKGYDRAKRWHTKMRLRAQIRAMRDAEESLPEVREDTELLDESRGAEAKRTDSKDNDSEGTLSQTQSPVRALSQEEDFSSVPEEIAEFVPSTEVRALRSEH